MIYLYETYSKHAAYEIVYTHDKCEQCTICDGSILKNQLNKKKIYCITWGILS